MLVYSEKLQGIVGDVALSAFDADVVLQVQRGVAASQPGAPYPVVLLESHPGNALSKHRQLEFAVIPGTVIFVPLRDAPTWLHVFTTWLNIQIGQVLD